MKSIILSGAFFISICLVSCNTATPQKYFEEAVLNSNMIVGFAQPSSFREMESPSAVMNDKGEEVPQKREEAIKFKIDFLEKAFEKINNLKETDETKEMLQASKAMYEYALPVYKNEYSQLAKLYDSVASNEKIAALSRTITDKYSVKFTLLYKDLIAAGKLYAAKNKIVVNWAD